MPNQLHIPFKTTYVIPVQQAVREYIQNKLPDVHPDAFKWDITKWDNLRKKTLGGGIHVDRIIDLLSYHAQLTFILTKLPPDIGLEIPFSPAFSPTSLPITLSNLVYDRCGVLYNLAALFSQLAASEDRSNADGLKRAIKHHQSAAGTLSYLFSVVLPKLRASIFDQELPLEFTEGFIKGLEWLTLAQAQECTWQLAKEGGKSSSILARLSAQVSSYYAVAAATLGEASPSIKHLFPTNWLPHVHAKQRHFEAVAQYRKSLEDLDANRYGHELARLSQAQKIAKEAYESARKGGVMPAVIQDINSLIGVLKDLHARAERDNDLIYHKEIPSLAALPAISPASLVNSDVPKGLIEPQSVLQSDGVIFGELLAWGAKTAIDIYNDRKNNLVSEEIAAYSKSLDDSADAKLRELNLPASLEALSKPIGLPPSLLSKAREVKTGDIPSIIDQSIETILNRASRNGEILDEAIKILDDEADEDESYRQSHEVNRSQSFEANQTFTSKHERYRNVLTQAGESDKQVREKWEQWQENILQLTWDEDELEASVPSSTIAPGNPLSSVTSQTKACARELRKLLERLDDLRSVRAQIVQRAYYAAEADDIKKLIMRQASGVERWTEVQSHMFEDTLDEELGKYDKYKSELHAGEAEQNILLGDLETGNTAFLESRKDDKTIKEREQAIQSLELAYHKCKEIQRNLEEGQNFHAEFGKILSGFKDECAEWAHRRQVELHSMTLSMASVSIGPKKASSPRKPPPASPQANPGLTLPPPDSEEWETMILPPAPTGRTPKAKGRAR